jgi:hypothetical protein
MRQRGTRRAELTVATPHGGDSRLPAKVARAACRSSHDLDPPARSSTTPSRYTVFAPLLVRGLELLGCQRLGEPKLFSLSGQRLHSEGQRGRRRWFQLRCHACTVQRPRGRVVEVSRLSWGTAAAAAGRRVTGLTSAGGRRALNPYTDTEQARRRHPRPGRAPVSPSARLGWR